MNMTSMTTTEKENKEIARDLLLLLQSLDTTICPFQTQRNKLPIRPLAILARYNKLTIALSHITTCTHCQTLISPKEYKKIQNITSQKPTHLLLLAQEKRVFEKVAKKLHIRYVYIKDKTNLQETFATRHHIGGTDLDVLVTPSAIPKLISWYKHNGYRVVSYPNKEINCINKKTQISVDIHETIAYPHSQNPLKKDVLAIDEVTAMCLSSKTPYLSVDMLLLTAIVRFWSNDLARGVRHIIDILELSYLYENTISWETLIPTLQRLGYYTRFLYLMLLGKTLFGIPRTIQFLTHASIPKRIRLAASLADINDILYTNDFTKWHTKKYQPDAKNSFNHYLFLTYLTDTRYPLTRLVHPRCINPILKLLTRIPYALVSLFIPTPKLPFPYTLKKTHPLPPFSSIGAHTYFTINGTSMSPFLVQGMVVETHKPTVLHVGDIVVVNNTSACVGHRITKIYNTNPKTYEIKGDAEKHPDGRFLEDDIIAVVTHIMRKGIAYPLERQNMKRLSRTISFCSRHGLLAFTSIRSFLNKKFWKMIKQKI